MVVARAEHAGTYIYSSDIRTGSDVSTPDLFLKAIRVLKAMRLLKVWVRMAQEVWNTIRQRSQALRQGYC